MQIRNKSSNGYGKGEVVVAESNVGRVRDRLHFLAQKLREPDGLALRLDFVVVFAIAFLVAIFRFQVMGNGLSPNNDDSVYWSQALALKSLQLLPQSPFPDMTQWFMVQLETGLVPKYLPTMGAYALLVSTPFGFTQYAFVTALVALVSLRFFLVEIGIDRWARLCALVLVGLNPMFFIHSSVLLSYIPSFTFGVLATALALKGVRLSRKSLLIAAGFTLGIQATMRPLDALCFSLAVFVLLAWRKQIQRAVKLATPLFFGLALVAIPTVAYCWVFIGRLELPFNLISGQDTYGFGNKAMVPGENFEFTLEAATKSMIVSMQDLAIWGGFFPLLIVLLGLLVGRKRERAAIGSLTASLGLLWLLLYFPFWGPANSQEWGAGLVFGPFYFIPTLFFLITGVAIILSKPAPKRTKLRFLTVSALVCTVLLPWFHASHSVSFFANWAQATEQYSKDIENFSKGKKVAVILPSGLSLGSPIGEFSNTFGLPDLYYFPLNGIDASRLAANQGVNRFASIETNFNPIAGSLSQIKLIPQKLLTGTSFHLKVKIPDSQGSFRPRLVIDNGIECRFYDLLSSDSVRFSLSPNANRITLLEGQTRVPLPCKAHASNLPLQLRLLLSDSDNKLPDKVIQDNFYPSIYDNTSFRKVLVPGIRASKLSKEGFLELAPTSSKVPATIHAKRVSISFPNPTPLSGHLNRLVVDRAGVCFFWDLDPENRFASVSLGADPQDIRILTGTKMPPVPCQPHDPTLPLQVRLLSHNISMNIDTAILFDDWFAFSQAKDGRLNITTQPIAHEGLLSSAEITFSE
jgi:hypothetical protein